MEKINVGIANLIISNEVKESISDSSIISEAKNITSKFINVIKNSPILQLESKVFNNLENKYINNELLATRYIDNNVNLFEIYTLDEINEEHNKLNALLKNINETNIKLDNEKNKLYSAISDLIAEKLKIGDDVNVDKLHESFNFILEHLKKPKENKSLTELENINENVIEIAIDKFNEKYKKMNEEDASLFKNLMSFDGVAKKQLFEEYKNKNIELLDSLKTENSNNDKINKSIEKTKEMEFVSENADIDIIKLYELNKGLK